MDKSNVSTYNPNDPEMFHVIIDNEPILQEDDEMRDRFKFIKSKRQPYNIKRLLTKAKFSSNECHEVKNVIDQIAVSAFRRYINNIQLQQQFQNI